MRSARVHWNSGLPGIQHIPTGQPRCYVNLSPDIFLSERFKLNVGFCKLPVNAVKCCGCSRTDDLHWLTLNFFWLQGIGEHIACKLLHCVCMAGSSFESMCATQEEKSMWNVITHHRKMPLDQLWGHSVVSRGTGYGLSESAAGWNILFTSTTFFIYTCIYIHMFVLQQT